MAIKNVKEFSLKSRTLESRLREFKKASILLLGDFILDQFIWGRVQRISQEAPVPVVEVSKESMMPGGALNVANNIIALGGKVYPCGVVGKDIYARMLVRLMRQKGVDTGGVITDPGRPTILKTRVIANSQQVVRFDREKSEDIQPRELKLILKYAEKKIQLVDGVIIEDYGKGVVTPTLIRGILKLATKYKKFVIVDPKDRHFSYYKGVTSITPNRKEAYEAVGLAADSKVAPEKVGKMLLRICQCKSVLMTMGEEGMLLISKDKTLKIPTTAKEVYDVSGAGDTVVAVFSLAMASGSDLAEAALLSNLAGGIVVGKLGTATVSDQELLKAAGGKG